MNIWELISYTREDAKTDIKDQYRNLYKVLIANCNADEVKALKNEWNTKRTLLIRFKDYEKLHINNGGVVNAYDDAFYIDFSNWIIAQGEDLYNKILNEGCTTVIDYINNNNITSDEYLYENIGYAFSDAEDYLLENGNTSMLRSGKELLKEIQELKVGIFKHTMRDDFHNGLKVEMINQILQIASILNLWGVKGIDLKDVVEGFEDIEEDDEY